MFILLVFEVALKNNPQRTLHIKISSCNTYKHLMKFKNAYEIQKQIGQLMYFLNIQLENSPLTILFSIQRVRRLSQRIIALGSKQNHDPFFFLVPTCKKFKYHRKPFDDSSQIAQIIAHFVQAIGKWQGAEGHLIWRVSEHVSLQLTF